MFLISTSALLLRCPRCDSLLPDHHPDVKPSHNDVKSCECGYSEPADSARSLTFIEAALDGYLGKLGISKFRADSGKTIDTPSGVSAVFAMPIFTSRASDLLPAGNQAALRELFPIVNIPDNEAFLKSRCVTTSNNINIAMTMLFLVEVVHEAMDLRPSVDYEIYDNELPIQHLLDSYGYGQPGSALDLSVKRTLNTKLNDKSVSL